MMPKRVTLFITRWFLLCLLITATSWASLVSIDANRPLFDIEVFVRKGCPHCEKVKTFLQNLEQEQPSLKIIIFDIGRDQGALSRLEALATAQGVKGVRVPAFKIRGQLLVGYSDEQNSGQLIREILLKKAIPLTNKQKNAASCETGDEALLSCGRDSVSKTIPIPKEVFVVDFWGYKISLEEVGLPLFTIVLGLLDGFNPCSMWVLLLVISLLAPMNNRPRMVAFAGTFVAVEGIAYFVFMAAWLNLFLFIGLSKVSEIIIAFIALVAGLINLNDFWKWGWGIGLSIPDAAKPAIYTRIRAILQAQNLMAGIIAAVVLAVLVQIVELLCTSGFPALYTRILTLKELNTATYYGYLMLYNMAYMLDDIIVLSIGIITLGQHKLQEKEGRWLKLVSGVSMFGLGIYLLLNSFLQ